MVFRTFWMQYLMLIFWVGAFIIGLYKMMHPTKKEWKKIFLFTIAGYVFGTIFKEGMLFDITTIVCFGGVLVTILQIHNRNEEAQQL